MKILKRSTARWFGLVAVLGVMALIGTATPASAGDAVAPGVVTGHVDVTPGVPIGSAGLGNCTVDFDDAGPIPSFGLGTANSFDFSDTVIAGALAATEGDDVIAVAGTIDVDADDGAGDNDCDNADAGEGPVDLTLCTAGTGVVVASTVNPATIGTTGGTVTCDSLGGSFLRVGTNVLVTLSGSITVGDGISSITATGSNVVVVAEFLGAPTQAGCPGGATACVKSAEFAGLFALESLV